jgi:hypothetical protein
MSSRGGRGEGSEGCEVDGKNYASIYLGGLNGGGWSERVAVNQAFTDKKREHARLSDV